MGLPPAVDRMRRPSPPPGTSHAYARYAPSREIAGAYTSPVVVRDSSASAGLAGAVGRVRIQAASPITRTPQATTVSHGHTPRASGAVLTGGGSRVLIRGGSTV